MSQSGSLSVSLEQVARLLADKGLDPRPGDSGGYFDLSVGPTRLCVIERPPYCDRGRFQVQADTVDILVLDLDGHDGFPRYYFDAAACALEIVLWLEARGLLLSRDQDDRK
jgi:hypothetical protein